MEHKKRTFVEVLRKFFAPVFVFPKESCKAVVPVVIGSFISIYLVYLLKEITNTLQYGSIQDIGGILGIFITLIIVYLLLLSITRNWTHAVLWPTYRKYMYRKYIHDFIYLDNNETEKLGTGKLVAMVDKGMHSWVDLLNRFFIEILSSIVLVIFSFVLIAIISWIYLSIVLTAFIGIFFLTYILQKRAKVYRKERVEINIALTRRFVKVLMSKFEVLQHDKTKEEGDDIANNLNKNIRLNEKVGNLGVFIDLSLRILIEGSKLFVIFLLGYGLFGNVIDFGEFVSLISIIYILDQILTKSVGVYVEYTKIYVDVEKLWDLFDTTPTIQGYETGKEFLYREGNIQLEHITYSYTKGKPVFKNFDLEISGGKITALVGNSGSGKSTLVKLISGYIQVDTGKIIVDEQHLKKVSLKSYYQHIGYLTQEPSVFDGTVLENLTYGMSLLPSSSVLTKEGAQELPLNPPQLRGKARNEQGELLHQILKLAKCEFIYDLPNGLDTEIGERGVRLSGGQRQRLAIAKIMLKDPKIIILDEPTSALDSFSEEQITKAMQNLFKGRTVIVIAHRLQTVKHADDIILLENGQVKERGTHKELVKLKGQYAKMLELQSGF